MHLSYLKLVEDWRISQSPAAAAKVALIVKSDEQIKPSRIPVHQGRYLDVDEILTRSLPSVSQSIASPRVKELGRGESPHDSSLRAYP